MADKLTPKQEAFCLAYIETGNASEAYRRCYNAENMKDTVIHVKACELLASGNVSVRVAELKAAHQKRHDITVDSLTEMLKEDRVLARTEGEANAAINAVLAIAKLHGLIVDKKNVVADHQHHHTTEPLSDSAHWVEKLLGSRTDSETPESLPN